MRQRVVERREEVRVDVRAGREATRADLCAHYSGRSLWLHCRVHPAVLSRPALRRRPHEDAAAARAGPCVLLSPASALAALLVANAAVRESTQPVPGRRALMLCGPRRTGPERLVRLPPGHRVAARSALVARVGGRTSSTRHRVVLRAASTACLFAGRRVVSSPWTSIILRQEHIVVVLFPDVLVHTCTVECSIP